MPEVDCTSCHAPSSMISIFFGLNKLVYNLFDIAKNKVCTSERQINSTKTVNLYHQRLGRYKKHVLKYIISSLPLNFSISELDFYDAC